MNKAMLLHWLLNVATRTEMDAYGNTEFGIAPDLALTDTVVRNTLVTRVNSMPAGWNPTNTPTGWTPPPLPDILTPNRLADATEGMAYNQTITVTPVASTIRLDGTDIPAGFTLTGHIMNAHPTAARTHTFRLIARDPFGQERGESFTLVVNPAPATATTPAAAAPLGGVAPVAAPVAGAPALAIIPPMTVPPAAPAPAGHHWEVRRNWLRRNRYVLVPDVVAPAPAAAAPPATDMGPFVLVGAALAGLVILFAAIAGTLWLINHDWDDNETTPAEAAAIITAADVQKLIDANKSTGNGGNQGQDASGSASYAGLDPQGTHFPRLESIDPAFRSGGWNAWLAAAGIKCESTRDARQPEEETNPSTGKISVAGLQVVAKNCSIPWPNIVTTDVPSRITTSNSTIKYQPDPSNGSTLYTNVIANGEVTIWADGSNWGQFTSKLGTSATTVAAAMTSTSQSDNACMSISELVSKYGIDRTAQGSRNGILIDKDLVSGATLTVDAAEIAELEGLGWTIQGSNPTVKSVWSPTSCRPLAE